MDSAEELKDHESRILNEVVLTGDKEEVIFQHGGALLQLLLGSIKVKVNIEMGQELSDGVLVGVALLLYHLDQVLQGEDSPCEYRSVLQLLLLLST